MALLSGALVATAVKKDAPPLIVTWSAGTLWIIVAAAVASLGSVPGNAASATLPFKVSLSIWKVGGLGFFVYMLVPIFAINIIRWTNLPIKASAVGANRDCSVYAGIVPKNVITWVYMTSSLLSAIAGVLWSINNAGAQTAAFVGYELNAVAIAVLGGTLMSGGYLRLSSVFFASLFWVQARYLVQGMNLGFLEQFQGQAINGIFAITLLAVVVMVGKSLSGSTTTIQVKRKTVI
jgi:ribose transport system permease protein